MRDPHLVSLRYRLLSPPNVSYRDPPLLDFGNEFGHFTLAAEELRWEPAEHFASKEAGRTAVEPFLRAWELELDLRGGYRDVRFEYVEGELRDRNPPGPGESQTILASAGELILTGEAAELLVTRVAYPSPPERLRVTPDVDVMAYRYRQFREGREPLTSMAQFCLTVLEVAGLRETVTQTGKRQAAGTRFNVEFAVLRKLGELCEQGDATQARKAKPNEPWRPLTASENRWIEECVKALIRQAGEGVTAPPPTRVTLASLPALP